MLFTQVGGIFLCVLSLNLSLYSFFRLQFPLNPVTRHRRVIAFLISPAIGRRE